jgi:aspartate aminotransferase
MNIFNSQNNHVSVLQQRILFAEEYVDSAVIFAENVPSWRQDSFAGKIWLSNFECSRSYYPSVGSGELAEKIIDHERLKYGVSISLDNVVITAGGMHALSLVFKDVAAKKPAGTVLCLDTTFVGVANVIELCGLKVRFVDKHFGNMDLEYIREHLSPDVCCMYLNSPQNPSGQYITNHLLAKIVDLCDTIDVCLVVDAVYDAYFFDGHIPVSVFDFSRTNNIYSVCSMSKNFGLPGIRIGWLMSSEENIRRSAFLLENENVSISSISQELANIALEVGNADLFDEVESTRQLVHDYLLAEFGRFDLPPSGTQMILPLPFDDIERFADYALNSEGLVLCTSSNYRGQRQPFVRLPFSYPKDHTFRALVKLRSAVNSYAKKL